LIESKYKKIIVHLILWIFILLTIIPFLYMVTTSLIKDTYVLPIPPIIIPKLPLYFGNFVEAVKENNFARYFLNSLFLASANTILTIFVSTLSAYGFSRLRFPGRNVLFYLYLFTMMVPALLNLVPQYIIIRNMGLVNKYSGLLLIYVSGAIAGNTFFLKGFFETIPRELEESVIVDGGTKWTIYRKIILPLSKPAIATLSIFTFLGTWDEFFQALTFIKSDSLRTLPIAIKLFQGQYATKWGLVFAASLIALVPVITIFVVFQKYFVRGGLTDGAVKG
jgi:multiple sugar transport system permease protein